MAPREILGGLPTPPDSENGKYSGRAHRSIRTTQEQVETNNTHTSNNNENARISESPEILPTRKRLSNGIQGTLKKRRTVAASTAMTPQQAGGQDIRTFFKPNFSTDKYPTPSPDRDEYNGNVQQQFELPSSEAANQQRVQRQRKTKQLGTKASTSLPSKINRSKKASSPLVESAARPHKGYKAKRANDSAPSVQSVAQPQTVTEQLEAPASEILNYDSIPERYEVEKILDYWIKYTTPRKEYYLIKWKGWTSENNTWELKKYVDNCPDVLERFFYFRLKEIMAIRSERKKKTSLDVTYKRMPLPPDPRPLERKICHYFKNFSTQFTDEEVEAANKKLLITNSSTKWTPEKLDEYLVKVAIGELSASKNALLRKQMIFCEVEYRREKLNEELQLWETGLNAVTCGMPTIKVENNTDFVGPPKGFTYVNKSTAGEGVVISDDPIIGCQCSKSCKDDYEVNGCLSLHYDDPSKIPYVNKKLIIGPGYPIIECNMRCRCEADCPNRVVGDGIESLRDRAYCIFRTKNGRGWGVKTLKPIEKGTFVSLYVGEIITTDNAEKRGKKYDKMGLTYLFDLDFNYRDGNCPYTIDAKNMGNVSHFINHSCDPNMVVHSVWTECINPDLPELALFSNKDIEAGEELTFNYIPVNGGRKMRNYITNQKCLCGSKGCKKRFF